MTTEIKPWHIVAWAVGAVIVGMVSSFLGVCLIAAGTYVVARAAGQSHRTKKYLLMATTLVAMNVGVTTLWVTTIGNLMDPELRATWSEHTCPETDRTGIKNRSFYDDEYTTLSKWEQVLLKRRITRTITCRHHTDGEDTYQVSGLALWWPFLSTEPGEGVLLEVGEESVTVVK